MQTKQDLLKQWYERAGISQKAHHYSAEHFGNRSRQFGVPTIVLTTIVGTSVFASLGNNVNKWLQIFVGLLSIAAAVLAALQTFLGYTERGEKHRSAAAKYGAIGRELEAMLVSTQPPSDTELADVRKRLDALALETPNTPIPIYRQAWENWENWEKSTTKLSQERPSTG
jgi:hypothetical protein